MDYLGSRVEHIKKKVLIEALVGTSFFLTGLGIALYGFYKTGHFNKFIFYGMTLISLYSVYEIGYIFYKKDTAS